jgi:hypothetical protein
MTTEGTANTAPADSGANATETNANVASASSSSASATDSDAQEPGGEKQEKKVDREAAKARRAAESVTDYKHEKEIDLHKAAAAVAALSSSSSGKSEVLFDGALVEADVTTLMDELDLPREQAEKFLRRNGGNLAQALSAYLTQ